MRQPNSDDPFAHLKQRASERADRTVERLRAGIVALQASGRKITAESIKEVTRDLEPGFAGLSFQVIRRNQRAYALYREAADAFSTLATTDNRQKKRRRRRSIAGRTRPSAYNPLQRLDKRDLVQRIRTLETELQTERQMRCALACDQQALRARLLRLEHKSCFCTLSEMGRSHEIPADIRDRRWRIARRRRQRAS
jgi:hypothetical protein